MSKLIVLHGVESVGKTSLGRVLAGRAGALFLPEFGRAWCEIFGTDCGPDDLLEIGLNQQENIEHALRDGRPVFSDTDALMTAAWAEMMLGHPLPELLTYRKADLYLYCKPDVPFVPDGLRIFGEREQRERFDRIAQGVLERANAHYVVIEGDWAERDALAWAAVSDLLA
jgi:nicotinamide riboside kinase